MTWRKELQELIRSKQWSPAELERLALITTDMDRDLNNLEFKFNRTLKDKAVLSNLLTRTSEELQTALDRAEAAREEAERQSAVANYALSELRQQAEDTLQTERTTVMTETAGAMAHEMSQPLTVALAVTELSLHYLKLDGKETKMIRNLEYINQMLNSCKEILHKIQNLRVYVTKEYVGNSSIIDIDKAGSTGDGSGNPIDPVI